jgi:folate-dependent phosphoribosylglycinamide formyltransferase PurN
MKVAILTSNPDGNAARVADHLAHSCQQARIAGVVVDLGTAPDRRRQLRRLAAWRRHGGLSYVVWRAWLELESRLRDRPAARYAHCMHELSERFGFEVIEVPNVNSEPAREALRRFECDLGISIGNRVIQPNVFSVPRLGTINLHHGHIPDYRGGPPAFWELYEGEAEMGVSVHWMDAQLDHGPVVAATAIPVMDGDDPKTLMERAYTVDAGLVATAVEEIAAGRLRPGAVDSAAPPVRTIPARRELRALSKRLGRPIRHDDYRRAVLPVAR